MSSRVNFSRKPKSWASIAFVIGTLLGSGVVWQFMEWRLNEKAYRLAEFSELGKARERVMQLQFDLMDSSSELARHLRGPKSADWSEEEHRLRNKIKIISSAIVEAEKQLADMENRMPRQIQTDFIPPARVTTLIAE